LLNDAGDKQELSYRLRLRAARFLTEDRSERNHIFDVLRDVYTFRSRLAHGETLEEMKGKDQAKLQVVLEETPRLLRRLLLKIMEEEGLRGLSKEELGLWWRSLELG
ncbi:MAG TPA: hypothetical protein VG477_04560, partial [Thermoanaerobaculia bacterium]|nr:hypothetical protein [Thermoanaerobaculia bacterium]